MAREKKKKVKPQLLKGFRDYPPSEQIARERMLAKVREVFELMGFLPLQTASLEFAEVLLGSHYNRESLEARLKVLKDQVAYSDLLVRASKRRW